MLDRGNDDLITARSAGDAGNRAADALMYARKMTPNVKPRSWSSAERTADGATGRSGTDRMCVVYARYVVDQ